MAAAPDMSFWLGRKYALLQQQADTGDFQAQTQRIGTTAAANVDNTRAALMPKESAANIAQSAAQTGLLREQTQWLGPEATARIGNLNAQAYATRIGGDVAKREGLDTVATSPTSLSSIRGLRPGLGGMPTMGGVFSADDPLPPRRMGESNAAYLDRINGF